MKKILLTFALLVFVSISLNAQSIKQDAAGNYYQDSTKTKTSAKATGKTFTDKKGVKYPVMISKNGKLFYVKTAAKSGIVYNVYIK